MNLNSFGVTIARIEAERLQQAKDAIAAGWTPDQHPATCCPPEPPQPPKTARTPEQRLQWFTERAHNATRRANRARNIAGKLATQLNVERRPDFGEINIPMSKRANYLESVITRARQLETANRQAEHWKSRADYWRNRATTIQEDS